MTPRILLVFEATFEPTLNMITKDFTEFPENRTGFYNLLRAINANCFPGKIYICVHLQALTLYYQLYLNSRLTNSNCLLTALCGGSSTRCVI